MSAIGAVPVPVCIDFAELCDCSNDLSRAIEEAFGVNGLGLVTVKDVPNYTTLRQALLPLAARLAQLTQEQKTALEDPLSSYNCGWSQGREKLENGAPDLNKGSFYANPLTDRPTEDPRLLEEQPAYCRPNIWPTSALPELEEAFKALGKVIYNVGMLVTEQCSKYLAEKGISMKPTLSEILSQSNCHKVKNKMFLFPRKLSLHLQTVVLIVAHSMYSSCV
jgi:isopenicillin N synthase-like dioxygenase